MHYMRSGGFCLLDYLWHCYSPCTYSDCKISNLIGKVLGVIYPRVCVCVYVLTVQAQCSFQDRNVHRQWKELE